jgi:Ankyrin repeats (3 copies)
MRPDDVRRWNELGARVRALSEPGSTVTQNEADELLAELQEWVDKYKLGYTRLARRAAPVSWLLKNKAARNRERLVQLLQNFGLNSDAARNLMLDLYPPSDGVRAIVLAARNGEVQDVLRLLRDGATAAACDYLPLRRAIEHGRVLVVLTFLDYPGGNADFALEHAVMRDRIDVVQALLQHGHADPLPVLCKAAEAGKVAMVEVLLRDARVNADIRYLNWSLCVAAAHGHTEVVKRLVQHPGVDPRPSVTTVVKNQHLEILRIFLRDQRILSEDFFYDREGVAMVRAAAESLHTDALVLLLAAAPECRGKFLAIVHKSAASISWERYNFVDDMLSSRGVAMLDCLNVLLRLPLAHMHAHTLIALAETAAQQNLDAQALQDLYSHGFLTAGIQDTLGTHLAAAPRTEYEQTRRALFPLAATSKTLPNVPFLETIVRALAPALPPNVTSTVWQIVRDEVLHAKQNRGRMRVRVRLMETSFERVFDLALHKCNEIAQITRALAKDSNPELAFAAKELNTTLDSLKTALESADPKLMLGALTFLTRRVVDYELQLRSALGPEQAGRQKAALDWLRSIAHASPRQLGGLTAAQQREHARTPQKRQKAIISMGL